MAHDDKQCRPAAASVLPDSGPVSCGADEGEADVVSASGEADGSGEEDGGGEVIVFGEADEYGGREMIPGWLLR